MTQTPDNQFPQSNEGLRVAPYLRVGEAGTQDLIGIDGRRHFSWLHRVIDVELADLGRWAKYGDPQSNEIIIPTNTRPASSVLSGMEAFPGEKEEVIRFMGRYVAAVFKKFGAVDESLGLDTVGVVRGNENIFVLPPHRLQGNRQQAEEWLSTVDQDLQRVLGEEQQRERLTDVFREATQFLREGA